MAKKPRKGKPLTVRERRLKKFEQESKRFYQASERLMRIRDPDLNRTMSPITEAVADFREGMGLIHMGCPPAIDLLLTELELAKKARYKTRRIDEAIQAVKRAKIEYRKIEEGLGAADREFSFAALVLLQTLREKLPKIR